VAVDIHNLEHISILELHLHTVWEDQAAEERVEAGVEAEKKVEEVEEVGKAEVAEERELVNQFSGYLTFH
jgi:hypothetical protein